MMKGRVAARLAALKISKLQAAKRMGKNHSIIYDLFREDGGKTSVKGHNLDLLAAALECSPEYLLEISDSIGIPPAGIFLQDAASRRRRPPPGWRRAAGVIEAEVFRPVRWETDPDAMAPVDPSLPVERQIVFQVRGNSATKLGAQPGACIIGERVEDHEATLKALRTPAFVIVEHTRQNGLEHELSVREVRFRGSEVEYSGCDIGKYIEPIIVKNGEIFRHGLSFPGSETLKIIALPRNIHMSLTPNQSQ